MKDAKVIVAINKDVEAPIFDVGFPFLLLGSYGRSHMEAGLLLTAWPVTILEGRPGFGRNPAFSPQAVVSIDKSLWNSVISRGTLTRPGR